MSSALLYHQPILSAHDFWLFRSPGPGLANLLFPISRAIAGVEKHGGLLLRPTIRQLKLGTFLRGEKDKRTYGGIFRHRTPGEFLDRTRAASLPRVDETEYRPGLSQTVVTYEGLGDFFRPLSRSRSAVVRWVDEHAVYGGLLSDA